MSYYFLSASEGVTGDGAEYSVSREFTAIWNVLEGVSNEWTALWNIQEGVSAEWTAVWNVQAYLSKEWTAVWDIGYYISREWTALWNIGMTLPGKVKYSFRTNAVVNRIHRVFING